MSSQDSPGTAGNTPEQTPTVPARRGVTVRRAPKYVPFLVLGALLGIAVAAVIAFGLPGDENYDPGAVFGFFLVLFGIGGAILGAIAALVLDRLSVHRAERAVVEAVPDSVADHGPEHDDETGTQDRA
jgi:hypothetical protein